jgi:membrane protein
MSSDVNRSPSGDKPIGELIGDASEQLSRLVRDELRLAVVELRQKGKRAGVGAGLLSGAAALGFYGGGAVVAAAILALALVLAPWLAALIVAVVVLVVAGVLALVGKSQLRRAIPPVPEEAARGLLADVDTVKEGLHR